MREIPEGDVKRKALVIGAFGQDASYLAELLTLKNYEVHGLVRRTASPHPRAKYLPASVKLHDGNLLDLASILAIQKEVAPDEVYSLAAESHVGRSFKEPIHTMQVGAIGTLNVLEAVRLSGIHSRTYIASTSEMFGGMTDEPCNESTPFHPRSPYGCAKLAAHALAVNYRESYRMFIACGLLFNHESERRGEEFVTRKITKGIARIISGDPTPIPLGNLDVSRDWGYAPDYVEGMWRMLQAPHASDYVLATGESYSLREFLATAFEAAGLPGYSRMVTVDPMLYRPAEVFTLTGDASKARQELGWTPTTSFRQLVKKMVEADIAEAEGSVVRARIVARG